MCAVLVQGDRPSKKQPWLGPWGLCGLGLLLPGAGSVPCSVTFSITLGQYDFVSPWALRCLWVPSSVKSTKGYILQLSWCKDECKFG